MNRCMACKWWDATSVYRKGAEYMSRDCRRHSPTVRLTTDRYEASSPFFPQTKGSDFCGDWEEFKPREEKG